jgi:hypothetical protein
MTVDRIRLGPFWLGLALWIGAITAEAQELRGSVHDALSHAAIPGAVVLLVDSGGQSLARTLTNELGLFRLAIVPSARQVSVLRIGFRPRTIQWTPGRSSAAPLDIALTSLPTMLQTVHVLDNPSCPRRPDREAALGLWEQARAALLSVIVARETHPALVHRLTFHRVLGEERDGALSQIVHMDSSMSTRPFAASRSADDFVALGFRDAHDDRVTYFGPDADLLVDEAFFRAYCFRLAPPDRAHPERVGLAFEPGSRRRERVDVQGTLWIDSVARRVDAMTFRYLGLSNAEEELGSGGWIRFRTRADGVPFIMAWSITNAAPSQPGLRVSGTTSTRSGLLELHEAGAFLADAHWDDGSSWHAALPRIRGRLLRHGQPVPDTPVRLVGTTYAATTDSSGRFEISDLVPGRYVFSLPDAQLNALGLELTRGQTVVVEGDSATDVDVEAPGLDDAIGSWCGRRAARSRTILVAGLIRRPDGTRARGAQIRVQRADLPLDDEPGIDPSTVWVAPDHWEEIFRGQAGQSRSFLFARDGEAGSGGLFFLCNAPARSLLDVEATDGEQRAESRIATVPSSQRLFVVDLFLRLPRD